MCVCVCVRVRVRVRVRACYKVCVRLSVYGPERTATTSNPTRDTHARTYTYMHAHAHTRTRTRTRTQVNLERHREAMERVKSWEEYEVE